jgi:sugar/nucleoside kinase (ribokinase family)
MKLSQSNQLIVVGNLSKDTISYEGKAKGASWGGAGLNISLAASLAGLRPKLISVIGEDGKSLLDHLVHWIDVETVQVIGEKSCQFYIKYHLDGTLIDIECRFESAIHLNDHFQTLQLLLSHYHICCRSPIKPKSILQSIVDSNLSFSVDFIFSSAAQQIANARKILPHARYVFVNLQEFNLLQKITNVTNLKKIIITSGSNPVRVLAFGKEVMNYPCGKREFLEVTGAGDVFIGTFLANQLQGRNLYCSLDNAVTLARSSLDSFGIIEFAETYTKQEK